MELKNTYGESANSLSTMKYWTGEFKRSHTSNFGGDCSARPNEVTSSEIIETIQILESTETEASQLKTGGEYLGKQCT